METIQIDLATQQVILDDYEKTKQILEKRKMKELEINKETQLGLSTANQVLMKFKNGEAYPLDDKAIEDYLKKLYINYPQDGLVKPQFIKKVLLTDKQNIVLLNQILGNFYVKRFEKSKTQPLVARPVKDIFSKYNYEIRHIATKQYQELKDKQIPRFLDPIEELEFYESTIGRYTTRLRYFADHSFQIEGREIILGIGITNSQFGNNYFEVALFEADCECSNQFISRNRRYKKRVVHKGDNAEIFKSNFTSGFKFIKKQFKNYETRLKRSNKINLKIKKIEEILSNPGKVNRLFSRVPDKNIKLIVEAFNEDNLGLTNFGLRSAITRVMRDKPELRHNYQLNRVIESLY